jgi:hypothetical protein
MRSKQNATRVDFLLTEYSKLPFNEPGLLFLSRMLNGRAYLCTYPGLSEWSGCTDDLDIDNTDSTDSRVCLPRVSDFHLRRL